MPPSRPSLSARCDTGGSAGSVLSLDFSDFLPAGAPPGNRPPLRSADFVEGVLLPEAGASAAGVELRARLERRTTGDDFAPLDKDFRITSGEWVGDYEAAESLILAATTLKPSLFLEDPARAARPEVAAAPAPPPAGAPDGRGERRAPPAKPLETLRITSRDWVADFQAPSGPMHPGMFAEVADDARDDAAGACPSPQPESPAGRDGGPSPCRSTPTPLPPLPDVATSLRANTVSPGAAPPAAARARAAEGPAGAPSPRKKKHRARRLDEAVAIEPSPDDVLCGRGGFTNGHPGNVRFRARALELRPWYERSSKEEKQRIADLLVESVASEGHRFLGRGADGRWHEVVEGAHRKASQALRERLRRSP